MGFDFFGCDCFLRRHVTLVAASGSCVRCYLRLSWLRNSRTSRLLDPFVSKSQAVGVQKLEFPNMRTPRLPARHDHNTCSRGGTIGAQLRSSGSLVAIQEFVDSFNPRGAGTGARSAAIGCARKTPLASKSSGRPKPSGR